MSEENTCDNSLNYQYNSNDDKKQTIIVLDYDLVRYERKEIFRIMILFYVKNVIIKLMDTLIIVKVVMKKKLV